VLLSRVTARQDEIAVLAVLNHSLEPAGREMVKRRK
jgi:hypothetical protein